MSIDDAFHAQLEHLANILNPLQDAHEAWRGKTGTCPVCGRPYQLTKTGSIRKHWARDGMGKGLPFSDPCTGTGQTPKEITR
jgi:hypothetical protein